MTIYRFSFQPTVIVDINVTRQSGRVLVCRLPLSRGQPGATEKPAGWRESWRCHVVRVYTSLLIQAVFSLLYDLSFLMLFCRKSLDLVECLIRLSDFGHYQAVTEIFKVPLQQCPDVLVFALLQIVWLSFLLILFAVSCYKHNLKAIVFRMIKSMFVVSFEDGLEQTEARVASILIRPLPLKPPQLRPSPHLCLARTGNTGSCARTASR